MHKSSEFEAEEDPQCQSSVTLKERTSMTEEQSVRVVSILSWPAFMTFLQGSRSLWGRTIWRWGTDCPWPNFMSFFSTFALSTEGFFCSSMHIYLSEFESLIEPSVWVVLENLRLSTRHFLLSILSFLCFPFIRFSGERITNVRRTRSSKLCLSRSHRCGV